MLGAMCTAAGRPASELTRRDVAMTLLTRPADEALAELPVLRQELIAAGNPLSSTFWASAESMLSSINARSATHGAVRKWLEATGTEPTQLLPDELFMWPDENERGPVTAELHALLVAHQETLVAAGMIDPDWLVAGDAAALASYRQIQIDWLHTPLPDGRVPRFAVADEEADELLREWADADRDAREILGELLSDIGPRPCPDTDLRKACARLRDDLDSDDPWRRVLRVAAGVGATGLPDDDRELWLTLASGVVAQRGEPPDDVLDEPSQTAWAMLDHASWIAAVVVLARGGPGTAVDVDTLSQDVAAFDFEPFDDEPDVEAPDADEEDEWFEDDSESMEDEAMGVSIALFTVVRLWRVLGAIDDEDRLTELGWWGLPESLLRTWQPDEQI